MLDRLALNDRILRKFPREESMLADTLKDVFYVLLGLPFFIFGFVNNYLPYRLPRIITKRVGAPRDYRGSLFMLIGTLTFLFFYGLQITLVQYFFHHTLLTVCYAIALPLTGFFAWFYAKALQQPARTLDDLLFILPKNYAHHFHPQQETALIDELEKGRKEYAGMNTLNAYFHFVLS
jgi:hypothetical protein